MRNRFGDQEQDLVSKRRKHENLQEEVKKDKQVKNKYN